MLAEARTTSRSGTVIELSLIHISSPCTVQRKCSSVGVMCGVEDRTCQGDAIQRGLEITCEHIEPRGFVYCPPGAQQRDSNIVWILLLVACSVAAVGGALSYLMLRKKLTR